MIGLLWISTNVLSQPDFLSWEFELERVENVRQREIYKGMFHEDYGEMKLLESRKNNYYGSHGYVLQNSYVEIQPPMDWYGINALIK